MVCRRSKALRLVPKNNNGSQKAADDFSTADRVYFGLGAAPGTTACRVATRAESDGDAVEIEVSDSGHGISPEDKERLFLPHFSTKERGTGLGLAIASRIVAEHNGTIRVEDNLPTGVRFLIRFPAAEVSSTPAAAGASAL